MFDNHVGVNIAHIVRYNVKIIFLINLFQSRHLRNDCLTLGVHGCIILVGPVQIPWIAKRFSENLHVSNQNYTTMNTQSKTVITYISICT